MDTGKAILFASVLLSVVIGVNIHLYRQDTACSNLLRGFMDTSTYPHIPLYDKGRLREEYAETIRYAEKIQGITISQCMNR